MLSLLRHTTSPTADLPLGRSWWGGAHRDDAVFPETHHIPHTQILPFLPQETARRGRGVTAWAWHHPPTCPAPLLELQLPPLEPLILLSHPARPRSAATAPRKPSPTCFCPQMGLCLHAMLSAPFMSFLAFLPGAPLCLNSLIYRANCQVPVREPPPLSWDGLSPPCVILSPGRRDSQLGKSTHRIGPWACLYLDG